MEQHSDIVLAFGESDEFRSLFAYTSELSWTVLPRLISPDVAFFFASRRHCIIDDNPRSYRL
jgi:hypothetical protein